MLSLLRIRAATISRNDFYAVFADMVVLSRLQVLGELPLQHLRVSQLNNVGVLAASLLEGDSVIGKIELLVQVAPADRAPPGAAVPLTREVAAAGGSAASSLHRVILNPWSADGEAV